LAPPLHQAVGSDGTIHGRGSGLSGPRSRPALCSKYLDDQWSIGDWVRLVGAAPKKLVARLTDSVAVPELPPLCAECGAVAPALHYRSMPVVRPKKIQYGPHRSNVGDLWLPVDRGDKVPVVVLIHGGFWRTVYTKRLMNALAKDVARRGWAAWNIEYRRVGPLGGGGGWPNTLSDVAAAIDHLITLDRSLDPTNVVTCGHSAGGQLALWAAGRGGLPEGSPGADIAVAVRGAVSLSGVVDLEEADRIGLGADATARFLAGHWEEEKERYRCSSPMALLPLGVPQALIHAGNDRVVPSSMSEDYQIRATELGDSARYRLVDGISHRELIDPTKEGWTTAVSELAHLIG